QLRRAPRQFKDRVTDERSHRHRHRNRRAGHIRPLVRAHVGYADVADQARKGRKQRQRNHQKDCRENENLPHRISGRERERQRDREKERRRDRERARFPGSPSLYPSLSPVPLSDYLPRLLKSADCSLTPARWLATRAITKSKSDN